MQDMFIPVMKTNMKNGNVSGLWVCLQVRTCATAFCWEGWSADFKLLWKDAAGHEGRCVVVHPRDL